MFSSVIIIVINVANTTAPDRSRTQAIQPIATLLKELGSFSFIISFRRVLYYGLYRV
jgi:hypothetical protein